jgi:hypothetical protein
MTRFGEWVDSARGLETLHLIESVIEEPKQALIDVGCVVLCAYCPLASWEFFDRLDSGVLTGSHTELVKR